MEKNELGKKIVFVLVLFFFFKKLKMSFNFMKLSTATIKPTENSDT